MVRRGVVQILSALLHNANLPGFITGRIWQAQPKSVCVPVLNCYSCPGALGACPIGSLQSTLAGTALKFPFYVGASAFIRAVLRARYLRLALPLRAGAGFVIQNPFAQAA